MALILTRSDIETALPITECIEAQEQAFREHALGTAVVPPRLALSVPTQDGHYFAMPAYLGQMPLQDEGASGAMAVKVLSFYVQNPARYGLPIIAATLLLHDPSNGALLAIMDAASLTGLRTAAGSAVATKYLARDDAQVLGLLGAGVQARAHLIAIHAVRPLQEARVYSRSEASRLAFADEMAAALGIPVRAVGSAREAVEGADIVVTATTAREPIVDGAWFAEGTHINCIGSGIPDRRELDDTIVQRATIVVDTREAALEEAGDLLIPMSKGLITEDSIHAELGEIIVGRRPGRRDDTEITLFKSVGVALQDVAAAARAYSRARALGIGQEVDL